MNIVPFAPSMLPARRGAQWITKEQVCELTGWSARYVEMQVAVGNLEARDGETRLRNGRVAKSYSVASLPIEAQRKALGSGSPRPILQLPAPAAPQQEELMPLFAAARPAENAGRVLSMSPEQETLALLRYEAIRPLVEYAEAENCAKYTGLRLSDGRAVKRAEDLAIYISQTIKVQGKHPSSRTLRRWLARYRAEGLNGLGCKTREDKGICHFFTRYPNAALLVAAEYHKPYATVARAFEALVRNRELLQIPTADMPSYSTVRNYLDSLPAAMRILAREGLAAYSTRCAPHVNRRFTDIPCNSIWVLDHQIHDVEVRNDCFSGAPMDAPIRPQLTCLMDLRSRKIVGYCWCVNGDSRSIATAIRKAASLYGPCDVVYTDNGRDMKKAAKGAKQTRPSKESVETATNELLRTGSLAQLGIEVQFCIPYSPQSKPVERLFGIVHGGLDAIMPHYTTGNAYLRPDQTVIAGAEHRKLMKRGLGSVSSLMPASIFVRLAETWIEQIYNATHRHGGRGMNGRTPNEVFDEGYPLAQRRTADPDVLALLLHERRTALVRRTAVTIDGRRYMPEQSSTSSWMAIHNANETNIVVVYDPLDPDRIIALDAQGRRMADLVVERLTEHPTGIEAHTANDAQIRDMMRIRAKLLSASAGTVKQRHRAVALAGYKSDLQHLAELAVLTPDVAPLLSQRAVREATKPSDTATAPASSFDIAADILGDLLA
jgi:transposase InsO family protein